MASSVGSAAFPPQPRDQSRNAYQALNPALISNAMKKGKVTPVTTAAAGTKRVPQGTRKKQVTVGADGTVQEKDLSKGYARCIKKVKRAMSCLTNFFHDRLGIDYSDDWWGDAMTIETLEEAVRDPDQEVVEKLLEAGVEVNEPIDEFGHTVLDALLVEQYQMLIDAQETRKNGISSNHLTEMFVDHEDAFFQIMDLLKDHGARLSGEGQTKNPHYRMYVE
jgi:hypothetical protein